MNLGRCGTLSRRRVCSLVIRSLKVDEKARIDSRRALCCGVSSEGDTALEFVKIDFGVGGRGDGVPRGDNGSEIDTFFGRFLFLFVGAAAGGGAFVIG